MRARGFEHQHLMPGAERRAFVWTTDLEGHQVWRRLIGMSPDLSEWQVMGQNLLNYCVPAIAPDRRIEPCNLNIICHSHALQGVCFACADGLKVNTLISVGSPVRDDMAPVYERASENIGFHWAFHSDLSDRWQILGALDGRFGITRKHPLAARPFRGQNVGLKGVGHSNILNDMTKFDEVWSGPIDLLRSRHGRTEQEIANAASTRSIA